MAAMLFMSIGIPMLSAGQDFLRSKHGVNNTYLRGDLNALDYHRSTAFRRTHAYFAAWIAFRRSEPGGCCGSGRAHRRVFSNSTGRRSRAASLVLIYNADGSPGPVAAAVRVNPTQENTMPIGAQADRAWRLGRRPGALFRARASLPAMPASADLFQHGSKSRNQWFRPHRPPRFPRPVEQGLLGKELDVVAVNDIVPADNLAYLLKYDSTQGRFPAP
jgi:pullulanase